MTLPIIHVAAAVIFDTDGRFLLASRPANKPYAGYWEFPGGKIEPGESPRQALLRELDEELGIQITDVRPWITHQHDYPTARVVLTFFRVYSWHGILQAREGQSLAWQASDAMLTNTINVAPLLPANLPVMRALALPPVLGITQAANDSSTFLDKLTIALARGLKLIQVRETGLFELEKFAQTIVQRAHAVGARVIINSDLALAQRINADGLQLTAAQLAAMSRRPDIALVGASCHNADELSRAEQLGCDYALLSPVLPTASHPGAANLGWPRFAELAANRSIPIYALGGLSHELLAHAQQQGAHGVALLRGAWQ